MKRVVGMGSFPDGTVAEDRRANPLGLALDDTARVPMRVRLAESLVIVLPIVVVALCGLAVWAVGPR